MQHGARHKRVVFLMGGWAYQLFYLWPTAKILSLHGFHVISYCYDYNVLSPDVTKTRESMLAITDDVLKQITKLKKQGKTDFAIFGTSLGTIPAVLVANQSPDITRVVLNTTSADLAKTVWTWDNVKASFKLALLNNNVTLPQLIKDWKPISAIYHIDNFKGKKVLVFLAKKDVVTPYAQGQELAKAIKAKGADCKVVVNKRYPHSITGLLNLVKPKLYMSFLRE